MAFIRWQFVAQTAISSRVITWFSAGHFSHVDCLLDDGQLLGARHDRVGGQPPGVRIRPAGYVSFFNRVVMKVACSDLQKVKFLDFLSSQIGKDYDTAAIWAFLFNRDWREPDSWICSELQAAAAEQAGVVRPLYLAANKITPVAWALAASAAGATVES